MNLLSAVLSPLCMYAVLAGGLVLTLYLFTTLKVEMRNLDRRHRDEKSALETALSEARAATQGVADNLQEVERQTGMLVPPPPARSGMNLSKRTQILRMYRSGNDSAGIAAALSVPRAEVDLLIKVHRIVVDQI